MNIVILSGGLGTRLESYSYPKPLNKIHNRYAIEYVLESLPDQPFHIHFVYNDILQSFNFKEIIQNLKITRTFSFSFFKLPYITRGAVESAYIGTISENLNTGVNTVFIDNDVINSYPPDFFAANDSAFIGCSIDKTESSAFSFVKVDEEYITEIREKERISNIYSCGIYGFQNISQFQTYAHMLLQTPQKCELYMSQVYKLMLEKRERVKCVLMKTPGKHIGSLNEVLIHRGKLTKRPQRICFDLDNTLVTYPTIPGDYSTVGPIAPVISALQGLYKDGNTIIIYTARRMATHKHNAGAAVADIARQTLDTLDKFGIPYHELVFGKPIADIYIDDRAINPYLNNMSAAGMFDYEFDKSQVINKLPNNKFNSIELNDRGYIVKSGPQHIIEGEEFYYRHIPENLQHYYPKFIKSWICNGIISIEMEYIKGISFYNLLKEKLITTAHLDMLINYMEQMHAAQAITAATLEDIRSNYVDKLKYRFTMKENYVYSNAPEIQTRIIQNLESYLQSDIKISNVIHGDLWFSNIYCTFSNELKVMDMRGKCGEILTISGDPMYDYAKIFQSLLGYDLVLYNQPVDNDYLANLQTYYLNTVTKKVNIKHLKNITHALIIGTFPFVESQEAKDRLWKIFFDS